MSIVSLRTVERRMLGWPARALILMAGLWVLPSCMPQVASEEATFLADVPSDTWLTLASIPVDASYGCAVSYGGRIYVFTASDTLIYTLSSDSWTFGTVMPTPRVDITCVKYGNVAYVIGGYTTGVVYSDVIEKYDLAAQSWSAFTGTLAVAREAPGSAVSNGFIYVFGGWNGGTDNSTDELDPVSEFVNVAGGLGTPVSDVRGAANDQGVVFAFGGKDAGGVPQVITQAYTLGTGLWSTVASAPTARYLHASVQVGGQYYVLGGDDGGAYLASLDRYDPTSDSWVSLSPMFTPRLALSIAEMGGLIFVIAGQTTGSTETHAVEVYKP